MEILIALMILGIGISSIFALFGAAARTHKQGVDQVTASMLAMTVLSDIERALSRGVVPASVEGKTHNDFPALYTFDVEIGPLPSNPYEMKCIITVHWTAGGAPVRARFATILLNPAPPSESE